MKHLKRMKVFQFALFQSILMGLIGILCGIVYSFGGLLIDVLVSLGILSSEIISTSGLGYGTILAFGALIGMPVIFTIAGFLLGIVEAFLYNTYTNWFGSLKIDFR